MPKQPTSQPEVLSSTDKHQSSTSVGKHTAIMSGAIILSRITGFIRTWAMAFALGSTFLTSSYSVANNLPNLLYELVCGGVIVTAFLPVYLEVKDRLGQRAANSYASSLFSIVALFTLVISILGIIFSDQVVWTMMFLTPAENTELASYFFKFFSLQIACYSLAAITSGLLNAEREYLWPALAPVFNNLVTIVTMFSFVPLSHVSIDAAKACLAVGTTLGVLVQLLVQIPAVRKKGLQLTFNLNLKNPALKQTVVYGSPIIVITIMTCICTAFETSTALRVSEKGPAIITYARMWWTLPHAFFAVPITTTLFTELSQAYAQKNQDGFVNIMVQGLRQQIFFLLPATALLAALATPIITLYRGGTFTVEDVDAVALYLFCLAPSLPLNSLLLYYNKVYGALRKIHIYSNINLVTSLLYVLVLYIVTAPSGVGSQMGLLSIPCAFFVINLLRFILSTYYLQRTLGALPWGSVGKTLLVSGIVAGIGAVIALVLTYACTLVIGSYAGSIGRSFIVVMLAGLGGLVVSYGLAIIFKLEEASYLQRLLAKLMRRFVRAR